MPSEFVDHFTRSLSLSTSRPVSPTPLSPFFHGEPSSQRLSTGTIAPEAQSLRKVALHELLVTLSQGSINATDVQGHVRQLKEIGSPAVRADGEVVEVLASRADSEESALEEAILGKLAVALYADALETYLSQASQVEAEAEWWADVEGSRLTVALFFLQTLPRRIASVLEIILDTLRAHQMPVSMSTLSPSSLRTLFASPVFSLRPSILTTAFFPHLQHQQSISLAVLMPGSQGLKSTSTNPQVLPRAIVNVYHWLDHTLNFILRFLDLPLELMRQECRYNRKTLEKLRDQRAEVVGELAQLRSPLGGLMNGAHSEIRVNGRDFPGEKYTSFLETLYRVVASSPTTTASSSPIDPLNDISQTLPTLHFAHTQLLIQQRLLRPSRLTRLWPSLLILPPLSLYVYTSYTSWIPALVQMTTDAKETVRGFVKGWLVEPLVDVLRTVRAGGGGDVLVHEEGVLADMESLQRMTLSLAQDTLNYTPEQLQILAEKVRLGDLTPVMQAYEQDIRSPLRSAITGTLLRNAFIQVQKAKVDIDQALSGIDKLLKSQELTFAFVGVAPAFVILYGAAGTLQKVLSGGRGKYGGRKRRRGVWEGLRRVERLLIKQPTTSAPLPWLSTSGSASDADVSAPLPPLPTGLLILSLTRLRSYALKHLPVDIREPFLEDLGDLEDTRLGKEAKLKVIERMWRCWGASGEGVIRF